MQGLLAYFYDHVRPGTWIELNQCRYNHMGMDVFYRSQPNFVRKHPQVGECRNDRGTDCEDCQTTPLDEIYSIHYTQCRKPWNCVGEGDTTRKNDKQAIPEDSVKLVHCMTLLREWNLQRSDLETRLLRALAGGDTAAVERGRAGTYVTDVFRGHCAGYGGDEYLPLAGGNVDVLRRIPDLYQ